MNGDVELAGDSISIPDGAVIGGSLTYRSPHEAEIADSARILGSVDYVPLERPVVAVGATAAVVGLVALLGVLVTGIAFYLLFTRTVDASIIDIRSGFRKCLGLGLAVFAATPVVIAVLFTVVVGWLPAVVVGPLYLILMLAGFLTGVFYAGDLGLGWLGRGERSRGRRVGSFLLALIVVTVLGMIPLLGTLLLFALMLLGVGALTRSMHRGYTAPAAA